MNTRTTLPGFPYPLGVSIDDAGAQFAIFSRHAGSVTLLLFESTNPDSPFEEVFLDPVINRTGDIWHIWIQGIGDGQLYGYMIDGEYNPESGLRFNKHKLILDPHAKAVTGNFKWDLSDARGFDPSSPQLDLSFSTKKSAPGAPKCIAVKIDSNWLDRPLGRSMNESVIYELHVKGFTHHASSETQHGGTFRGLEEKIPYLKELGVNTVELMPIQEFDEEENINVNPLTGEKLKNYWGYSTISFFAPKGKFSSSGTMGEQVHEFREMVGALHRAGIEVILDVVFNHTAEGDQMGPTLCFRGIDNPIYYILEKKKRFYRNYSGCGNTFNCNHPIVRDFILDCLKYWVVEMHVDGFRFDLASILGRDQEGNILSNPPLLERIAEDPILRNTKIIAEAWDAAGAYQVGYFPGRWAEWNGKYRDDVRKFWRGDTGSVGLFATRLTGSSDLYGTKGPLHSINFITCHDGFTLNDLVSYNNKHNTANGERNRDGENYNLSYNFGIEGQPATPYIQTLRERQIRNFFCTLFLSQGIPMMTAGDEFRKTQQGNNNPYCQDNDISWINWSLLEQNRDVYRFVREMIGFRKEHPVLRKSSFFTGMQKEGEFSPDITWHGPGSGGPDWSESSHCIACCINGSSTDNGTRDVDLFMVFNASLYNKTFVLPPAPSGKPWRLKIDTSRRSPDDFLAPDREISPDGNTVRVQRFSSVVLISG
ncbi:MAG TPA: glycogen debranching protein GlgX [Spirochaetota bacterium]|nr:glycogen debranching protein GlgX [Spirochaetota bacterium]